MDTVIDTLIDIRFRLRYLNAVKENAPKDAQKQYDIAIYELCRLFTVLCHNDGKCKEVSSFTYDVIMKLDFTVFN